MDKILVLGSINIDFVAFTERFPKPGETINGNSFNIFQGGKGANQAIALAKLGCPTWMLGKIGDDKYSTIAIDSFKKNNVNIEFIKIDKNTSTGSASIWVNKQGENSIIVNHGANASVSRSFINNNEALFNETQWFLSQLEVPISSVMQGLKIAKKYNMYTVVDPAPAQKVKNSQFWNLIDYLLPNEIELEELTGESNILNAINYLNSKGVKEVIVKMGEKGAGYKKNKQLHIIPAFQVGEVIDTTGAGDCFTAGFINGLIEHNSIEKAIKMANLVASYSVQKKGAAVSFPGKDEVNWNILN